MQWHLESKNPGKSDENAQKIKRYTNQAINSCVQKGARKDLKKQHKNSDFISNKETNAINKFKNLVVSDNSSNDKGKFQ
eukprot:3709463-Ditylum_brightwellii.AAC.1